MDDHGSSRAAPQAPAQVGGRQPANINLEDDDIPF
jgi:hypothetical protein